MFWIFDSDMRLVAIASSMEYNRWYMSNANLLLVNGSEIYMHSGYGWITWHFGHDPVNFATCEEALHAIFNRKQ